MLLLAASAATWFAFHQKGIVRYTTAAVTSGAVTRAETATGTVNPVLTIIVGTYVSGVIQQLYCDYNTEVTVGQICVKIDPRTYPATVDEDKANLDVAKAQLPKDHASLVYAHCGWSAALTTTSTRKW